jgi:hypothetical protein
MRTSDPEHGVAKIAWDGKRMMRQDAILSQLAIPLPKQTLSTCTGEKLHGVQQPLTTMAALLGIAADMEPDAWEADHWMGTDQKLSPAANR